MIPVNEPRLEAEELAYVTECVKTGWVSSSGRFLELFEQEWAKYCNRKHGVAVCNGSAALLAAMTELELQPGDEVIMPTFTIISCAHAVVQAGGVPVLVDCDPRTWTMDVDQVEAKITPQTRAIMAVHIYGHPVDMAPLEKLASDRGLVIVEDAAEAHGAEYGREGEWRRCGSFGLMSTFSFYANKLVTTGEGGMVLTDDDRIAERLRSIRNLGFGQNSRFRHETTGYNLRMTNMQAALGLAQTERIGEIVERKRHVGSKYTGLLRGIDALQLPVEEPWARNVYWMNGVVLREEVGRDAAWLAEELEKRGVQTRPFFLGMHEQPVLRKLGLFKRERYPVAEGLARRGLYLPSGVALTDDQLSRVCGIVSEVLS